MASRSCWHRSAMAGSSSREKTLPEGLLGLLKTMARVRGRHRPRQTLGVERKSGGSSGPSSAPRPRGGARAVVLVKRLEHDDLVTGVQHRQQGRQHRLGGAAADGDVQVGIDLHAVAPPVFLGDGAAQARRPPGDRVLVKIAVDGPMRRIDERLGRSEVRHPLGEVHPAVLAHHPRHLADDRLGEALDALGDRHRLRSQRPPAMAGTIATSSPSLSTVALFSRNRMSSWFT